ncbi:MAG: hypothetical protein Q9160_009259, partial [Pyrenula sp. 1 TL-2023]
LLDLVASTGTSYLVDPDHTVRLRTQLLTHLQSLQSCLIDPESTLLWLSWAEPARRAALVAALDLDVFPALASSTHVSELAASTGAASELLTRLLRHLAATGVIRETATDTYAATPLSRLLCDERHAAAVRYSIVLPTPMLAHLPKFLHETGYKDPQKLQQTPFQDAMETKKSPWEWARTQPDLAGVFALHMSGYHAGQTCWMDPDFYPVKERLINGCLQGEHEILVVDVGGGLGHDLEEFKRKYINDIEGRRLVLQDLKVMVRAAKALRPWIECQSHDFFKEQPLEGKCKMSVPIDVVKVYLSHQPAGARTYLLHSVLHDWRDQEVIQILQKLRLAMRAGYSKILIYEHVVPERGASWRATALDLIMMGTGSLERTEEQWNRLIKASGLQVAGTWTRDQSSESLIEVVLERPKL